jgi:hypothetical protein
MTPLAREFGASFMEFNFDQNHLIDYVFKSTESCSIACEEAVIFGSPADAARHAKWDTPADQIVSR